MHEEGDEYVEMVTVLSKGKLLPSETWFTIQCKDNELYIDGVCQAVNKLYLKVPKNEWVGLTDEEYDELMLSGDWGGSLIQATQAKLKEKNQE